ncbi:MAG: alpha-L-arabinofuranosidase C-terminal domain-containing protein [Verrucomicrobiia bacterium]
MKKIYLFLIIAGGVLSLYSSTTVEIDLSKQKAQISPFMWGVFFEDINFGADGGLSAEMVKNRGFEFPDPLMGWKTVKREGGGSTVTIATSEPFNEKNPHYLVIKNGDVKEFAGVINEGYRGIGIKKGETYRFFAFAKSTSGSKGYLEISICLADGTVVATKKIANLPEKWKQVQVNLKPDRSEQKAFLRVLYYGRGEVALDMVSLYPTHTWRNRPDGLRADLVQMLADMKPGFVRFPGGCIVEGRTLDNRYQWKNTIGKPEERKLIVNRWNMEFKHRPAPDYYQSYAVGFYEFFQLCEDIGAEPLPILNCGMACQFNSGELAPLEQLDQYIQDALDLIEFANGNPKTKWGKVRAELGHPKPFNLKMIGVGNEQWGPQYIERYKKFAAVLKQKHPEIMLVSSAGPDPDGQKFEYLWGELKKLNAEIIDEHYYRSPSWFLNNVNRYDSYDRNGPKVFAGEYAAQSAGVARPDNKNTLECAISEAAFMTGLEKNADVVRMASYAPLFAHVDAWQWTPDLIWFDNLSVYGTPSYYVQKMFSINRGDVVMETKLKTTDENKNIFVTSALDKKSNELIIKIVNASGKIEECEFNIHSNGVKIPDQVAKGSLLGGKEPNECNSIENPKNIYPVETSVKVSNGKFLVKMPRWSLIVLRINL